MDPIHLMTCGGRFLSSEDASKVPPQLQMILKRAPSYKPPVKHKHRHFILIFVTSATKIASIDSRSSSNISAILTTRTWMFNADDIVAFICLKVLTLSFQMSSVSPMPSCSTFAVVSAVYIERPVRAFAVV